MAPDRKRKGVTASTDAAGNGATQQASGVRVKREPLPENNAATSVKTEEFDRSSRRQSARIKSEPGIDSAQPGLAGGGHASKVAVEIEAKVKLEQWTATAEEASVKQEEQQKVTKSPGKKQKLPQPLGPFPDMGRPLPEECRAARDGLAALHGMPEIEEVEDSAESKVPAAVVAGTGDGISSTDPQQRTVLDSLVRTILSQNTTDTTSKRAFLQLKASFPTWDEVLHAPDGAVEDAIRCGGLAEIKVQRIREILTTVLSERGELSLEYVRELGDAEIKEELSRFKGVGPKTVACVLMFCLRRKEFPVDTHVWRITKSLGWVPPKASREQTYEHLNLRVPDDVKYTLHVLLVRHGKQCPRCAKGGRPRFPSDGPCPLVPAMLKGGGKPSLQDEAAE
mmetsp:Transcript_6298/g.18067  ORF Transcript_6298/g.18067 Transcript_6298/m.18067 type:complete len:395 (-) Transcript_6298:94-1278(-)